MSEPRSQISRVRTSHGLQYSVLVWAVVTGILMLWAGSSSLVLYLTNAPLQYFQWAYLADSAMMCFECGVGIWTAIRFFNDSRIRRLGAAAVLVMTGGPPMCFLMIMVVDRFELPSILHRALSLVLITVWASRIAFIVYVWRQLILLPPMTHSRFVPSLAALMWLGSFVALVVSEDRVPSNGGWGVIPTWEIIAAIAIAAYWGCISALLWSVWSALRMPLDHICNACGYDVSHGQSERCPECGGLLTNM